MKEQLPEAGKRFGTLHHIGDWIKGNADFIKEDTHVAMECFFWKRESQFSILKFENLCTSTARHPQGTKALQYGILWK
ncbi:MAG: hypothetical protein EZS28_020646 [Streblomastix strix]|uniref:Uncharacterized protein n=1 Tax=Streblomastix strix TaxID=222440 RepID=A0A5J4VMF9_9EUKA|nr:MAG: hypothetical protein EZS28_020646 [Streblomastix strix]